MSIRNSFLFATLAASLLTLTICHDGWAQRGGRGGGGGGRSAGNRAPAASRPQHSGPAMTRPAGHPGGGGHPGAGNVGGGNRPNVGGGDRPNVGGGNHPNVGGGNHPNAGGGNRPNVGGGDRPNVGGGNRPNVGGDHSIAGKPQGGFQRPSVGGGNAGLPKVGGEHPGAPNVANRPGNLARPGVAGGASNSQVSDFLGLGGKVEPGGMMRPPLGKIDRPDVGNSGIKDRLPGGQANRPGIGNDRRPDVNVGNVNVGNSVNYSNDQKAWVNNQHNTGNLVRTNAGNRYYGAYNSGLYRRGVVGGYPYYGGWANRGPYYGWRAASYVTLGTFMGAAWANTQPVYYAYGTGGNVYYDNNVVYVNDQPAGTPEQYTQQVLTQVTAAPATATDTDWLPLGAFAFTREGVDDSQAMIELAINKQGIIAGTYYNEATGVSRSFKGTLDRNTQRVAIGFADGKNENVALETGIYNLTQDEAPGMLHFGTTETQPVLLVRLQPPAEQPSGQ